jgi:putative cell wall-binding protein
MAKENQGQVDELNKKIEFLNQELLKANERIISTNERLISVIEMVINQVSQPASARPPKVDYDNSDHDDYLNKQIEKSIIRKGMTSQAYNGRVVSIHLIGDSEIRLRQQSHHLRMKYGDGYKLEISVIVTTGFRQECTRYFCQS